MTSTLISVSFCRRPWSALLLLGALLAAVPPAAGTPYTPADDATLEQLPENLDPAMRALQARSRQQAGQPVDAQQAERTARELLERGRRDGDPRLVGRAQAALQPWWDRKDPPAGILFLRASLKQTVHQFSAALVDLDSYLQRTDLAEGSRAQGLLTRATVLSVVGRLADSRRDCAEFARHADRLTAFLCTAQLDAQGAQARRTLAVLQAYGRQGGFGTTVAVRHWGALLSAETAARLGEAPAADQVFQAALREDPADSYTLAAYADFLLDHGRPAEVDRLLVGFLRADNLLLRHAIALRRMHDPRAPDEAAQYADRVRAARERGDHTHLREEALFALAVQGDAATALRLAEANWQVQKEPADLRILAEAARATHDRNAEAQVRDWLTQTGLIDLASEAVRQLSGPA